MKLPERAIKYSLSCLLFNQFYIELEQDLYNLHTVEFSQSD
jgi:hypothetical protein